MQYPTGAGDHIRSLLTQLHGIFLGVVCIYISQKKLVTGAFSVFLKWLDSPSPSPYLQFPLEYEKHFL